jgi:hypothetical protein
LTIYLILAEVTIYIENQYIPFKYFVYLFYHKFNLSMIVSQTQSLSGPVKEPGLWNLALMFRVLFCLPIILVLMCSVVSADSIPGKKYVLFLGMGNYEYLHAGAHFIHRNKSYFEAAAGFKTWSAPAQKYKMAFVAYGFPVFKKKHNALKYFLQLKALFWDLDNDAYQFSMLGTAAEMKAGISVGPRCSLLANAGLMYNNLLKYDRKSFTDVGFPKDFQPSFSLQLCYHLN